MKHALLAVLFAWPCITMAAHPRPDPNSVTLPTFLFERRHAVTAGTAFLVEAAHQRFLVTAFHVLGPTGGLKLQIPAREVPREVKAIAGVCLGETGGVLVGAPVLLVEDARAVDSGGADRDVTLALVKSTDGPVPLKLSTRAAAVGDRVWLFGRLKDRELPTTYPAKVTDARPTALQYELEDSSLNLRALSGAPLLAEDGLVVGMQVAFAKQDDKLIAVAAPAAAIRERIIAATKKPEGE